MFPAPVFCCSLYPHSIFPIAIQQVGEQIDVPGGTSGSGGSYSGLTAPMPRTRYPEDEEKEYQHDQDIRDMIDIITIMVRGNIR